jgi:hypothetical protein
VVAADGDLAEELVAISLGDGAMAAADVVIRILLLGLEAVDPGEEEGVSLVVVLSDDR